MRENKPNIRNKSEDNFQLTNNKLNNNEIIKNTSLNRMIVKNK